MDFGPVRRWKDGGVLWAENDFIRMAYAITVDEKMVGKIGLQQGGDHKTVYVEFIDRARAKLWD